MPNDSDKAKMMLCPYCGHTQVTSDRCEQCRGLFEPLSRKATQIAMGPWYVRDAANPFRPGCSYETLKRQIDAGRIKPNTVMRGPTTRQFWSVARHVPGVAHLLGYCHQCGERVQPTDKACPSCHQVFREVAQRNELGLAYPTATAVQTAQHELQREMEQAGGLPTGAATSTGKNANSRPAAPESSSADEAAAGTVTAGAKAGSRELLGEMVGMDTSAERHAAARRAKLHAGAGGASGGGQTLDFAPSEQSTMSSDSQTAPIPVVRRHGWMVWLLVGLNVLAVIILALVFVALYFK